MHRELDLLLGDEGAVNMIYEAENGQTRPNKRPQRPDLSLKARLVRTAVIRLSAAPASSGLRARRKTEPARPVVEAAPPRPTADESRIIRRHSTSSSEDETAPTKKPIFIKKADKQNLRPKKTASVFPTIRVSIKLIF